MHSAEPSNPPHDNANQQVENVQHDAHETAQPAMFQAVPLCPQTAEADVNPFMIPSAVPPPVPQQENKPVEIIENAEAPALSDSDGDGMDIFFGGSHHDNQEQAPPKNPEHVSPKKQEKEKHQKHKKADKEEVIKVNKESLGKPLSKVYSNKYKRYVDVDANGNEIPPPEIQAVPPPPPVSVPFPPPPPSAP